MQAETKVRELLGLVLALALAAGCGGRGEREEESDGSEKLSAFELEHGIGPVKEAMALGALDPALAANGKAVYETKCSMCHKMDTTYVGPPLGQVTSRRTPAFIMNMILNPQEMVERHPVAKQLLAERMSFMPNQQLTMEDARAVLEYLRTEAKGPPQESPKEE